MSKWGPIAHYNFPSNPLATTSPFKYNFSISTTFFCLQSLHFFYGLGALVSPVIAEPFLRSACSDGHFKSNIFGWTLENSTLERLSEYSVDGFPDIDVNLTILNETISQMMGPRHYHTKSFVQYAYWLVALLQVSSIAWSFWISLFVWLSTFLSVSQSVCLSVYLSVCLSVCLSVYLSFCSSVFINETISRMMGPRHYLTKGIFSWSNTKFFKLTSQELYGRR